MRKVREALSPRSYEDVTAEFSQRKTLLERAEAAARSSQQQVAAKDKVVRNLEASLEDAGTEVKRQSKLAARRKADLDQIIGSDDVHKATISKLTVSNASLKAALRKEADALLAALEKNAEVAQSRVGDNAKSARMQKVLDEK